MNQSKKFLRQKKEFLRQKKEIEYLLQLKKLSAEERKYGTYLEFFPDEDTDRLKKQAEKSQVEFARRRIIIKNPEDKK